MKKIALFVALLLVVGSATAMAGICPKTDERIHNMVQSDHYLTKTGGMVFVGINRIVAAPFEVLYHPVNDVFVDKEYATGLFTGLAEGVFRGVESAMVGAWNLLSSPVPDYHGETTDHTHSLLPCSKS